MTVPADARRLALSEHLRTAAQRLVAVRPGDEEATFDDLVVGLADVLDLTLVARWDVARHGELPTRRLRWVRDDVELQAPNAGTLQRENPFVAVATSASAPVVLDDTERLAAHGLLSGSALAGRLTRLLVPGRSDESVDCVLVLGRLASSPWTDWEQEMLAEFARLIPIVRGRIDVEHRMAASFDVAPVGITLSTDDLELADCNRAFSSFLGHDDPGELRGRRWTDLVAADHADDATLAAIVEPGAGSGSPAQAEVPFVHRAGYVVWGRVSRARVASQHGDRWMSYIEDVSDLRRQHEIVRRRATRDPLTGLANRHVLRDVLEEQLNTAPAPDGRAACAIVLLDLNDFKQVNDVHGHAAGDAALTNVGERLRACVRASDLVARYGGDEFVVVLGGPIGAADADRLAQRFVETIREPMVHEGVRLAIDAAVGVTLGRSGEPASELLADADAKMYADKLAPRP